MKNTADFSGIFELFAKNDNNMIDAESLRETAKMYCFRGLEDEDYQQMCTFAKSDGLLNKEDFGAFVSLTLAPF